MAEDDYVKAVQRRMCARVIEHEVQCRQCGMMLDPMLDHSDCCAPAESTRGHYSVVRAFAD
eukprot:10964484-Karenia_brevis.AAC.2